MARPNYDQLSLSQLAFDAAVVSYGRNQTPHFVGAENGAGSLQNEDYGIFVPQVGLFVADGVGGAAGGAMASKVVAEATAACCRELEVNRMTPDEAVDAVREQVLPFADQALAERKDLHKLPSAATTLGALILGGNHVVAVGVGDTLAYQYQAHEGENIIPDVLEEPNFHQITPNQGAGNIIFNSFEGKGRTGADHVEAVSVYPGDRFLVATDGLLGDRSHQNIPDQYLQQWLTEGKNPEELAERIARGPNDLRRLGARVIVQEGGATVEKLYSPKTDDLTVGVMLVRLARSAPE